MSDVMCPPLSFDGGVHTQIPLREGFYQFNSDTSIWGVEKLLVCECDPRVVDKGRISLPSPERSCGVNSRAFVTGTRLMLVAPC